MWNIVLKSKENALKQYMDNQTNICSIPRKDLKQKVLNSNSISFSFSPFSFSIFLLVFKAALSSIHCELLLFI